MPGVTPDGQKRFLYRSQRVYCSDRIRLVMFILEHWLPTLSLCNVSPTPQGVRKGGEYNCHFSIKWNLIFGILLFLMIVIWCGVHRVILSTSVPLIFSIYKGFVKNWNVEICKDHSSWFGNGDENFIWVACAYPINWLLAHNCYLVAFLSHLAHL